MATLYVTEFGRVASGVPSALALAQLPALASQTVAIGGASVQSAAFNPGTQIVRVHTDVICSVAMGVNPTAVATQMRMAANQTEYFSVAGAGAGGLKIAVITNT